MSRPLEPWEREIVAETSLDARCLISQIANLMYPELTYARDRENKLRKEGGDIIARIEAKANAEVERCAKLLGRASMMADGNYHV